MVSLATGEAIASSAATLGTWSNVSIGLGSPTFTPAASVYPNAVGVTFKVDGALNRTDATGPQEGSVYEVFPRVDVGSGTTLTAEWTDRSGAARASTFVVGASAPPPPPAPPPAALGTWSNVSIGLRNPVFTPDAAVYPNSGGIRFTIDGLANRTDATGPQEGSVYEMFPAVDLRGGETLTAAWVDRSGAARTTTFVVQGASSSPAPPPTGSATLTWDASPDARVTGYLVYNRLGSAPYLAGTGVPTTANTLTASGFSSGTWCFAVSAVGAGLESVKSAEACKVMP